MIINLKRFSPQAYQFGEGFFPLCCQLPAQLLVNVMNIKTNNVPRRLLFACELSQPERAKLRRQYDWMDEDHFNRGCSFFKYRGEYYNLSDFLTNISPDGRLKGWHGIASDSRFSGVVVKLRGNDVIVGRYFC